MLFIFGWGRQLKKIFGPVFKQVCSHCNNEDYWILKRISTWFTLFFIPVIPYEWKYFLMCPVCEYGMYLKPAQFNELKPIAELNTKLVKRLITTEQYNYQINNLNTINSEEQKSIEPPQSQQEPQGNQKLFCHQCGAKILVGANFCKNCGAKI